MPPLCWFVEQLANADLAVELRVSHQAVYSNTIVVAELRLLGLVLWLLRLVWSQESSVAEPAEGALSTIRLGVASMINAYWCRAFVADILGVVAMAEIAHQ